MKPTYYLKKLKELSKRYARARQVPLHKARDTVAEVLGFSHWNDVTKAHRAGWTPTKEHVSAVERLLIEALPAMKLVDLVLGHLLATQSSRQMLNTAPLMGTNTLSQLQWATFICMGQVGTFMCLKLQTGNLS